MASSTKVRAAEQKRAQKLGERLAIAMRHAGLSSGQLERLILGNRRYRREAGCVTRWLAGELTPVEVDVLEIARLCKVDPRWLATGQVSAAAKAALEKLGDLDSVSPELAAIVRQLVTFAVSPRFGRGTCRYCLCTFYEPCAGGCAWVDDEETICSACLTPEGRDD